MREYTDYENWDAFRPNNDHDCRPRCNPCCDPCNPCRRERRCHDYIPPRPKCCNKIILCCEQPNPCPPTPPTPPITSKEAFIFAQIIGDTTVDVDDPIPFNVTVVSENILLLSPYTTFTFLKTGFYLVNLSITTDIQQIATIVTNTGGPQTTTYNLSPNDENKVLTAIIEVTEPNTNLQFVNALGTGNITSATITINKIAKLTELYN